LLWNIEAVEIPGVLPFGYLSLAESEQQEVFRRGIAR
jgi:hypothetical protein